MVRAVRVVDGAGRGAAAEWGSWATWSSRRGSSSSGVRSANSSVISSFDSGGLFIAVTLEIPFSVQDAGGGVVCRGLSPLPGA